MPTMLRASVLVLSLLIALPSLRVPVQGAPSRTARCGPVRTEGKEPSKRFPNDPLAGRQWGLEQIRAVEAWRKGAQGKGATIAVIDTGIDLAHPDLHRKVVLAKGLSCGDVRDEQGHGTHVAGIAAASTDNGVGVAGVAPKARLMPIMRTSSDADQIKRAVDSGANVINMSFASSYGPTHLPNDDLTDAFRYARERDVVLVAAAGNFFLPYCSYPAVDPLVLCVAGTDRRELPAHFSHLPVKPEFLAVRAPAGVGVVGGCADREDIWSTLLPGSSFESCPELRGYAPIAGTSMASPHVAGVAALLSGLGLDDDEIIECITGTARNPLTDARGEYDLVYGYGIVDAAAAVSRCR